MAYPEFPDPQRFTPVADVLAGDAEGTVTLHGWIHRTRASGKLAFVVVRDATGVLQCTVSRQAVPEDDFAAACKALLESSVVVSGTPARDERAPGGWELRAERFTVVHYAAPFPITRDQSDEHLLNNRHLWLRSRDMVAALKVRATVFRAFRDFWDGQGYTEVQSPGFVTGACEGGSTLFNVYCDDDDTEPPADPPPGAPTTGQRFYAHLTQSWQLYAEATMFGLERIYTVAPSFRAEKSRTRRHLTEFWHAEVEAAWMHNHQMMALEEAMLVHIVSEVLAHNAEELAQLGRDTAKLAALAPPFPRLRYDEVLSKLNARGFDLAWGDDFGYREEKALTAHRDQPLFITHFPRDKGFYHRPDPAEPRALLCHDLLAPEGYGEIIGGGERVWDPEELDARLREEGIDPETYGWYLDLRRFGSVPHTGFGLGLDRVVAWLCGAEHIKHVIAFPRTMRRTTP